MTNCVFIDYLVRRLSQEMYKKVTYIRMCKSKIQEKKNLFIPIKVQLITISSLIPYISEINSTSSSLKKKKKKKNLKIEKGRGKERKRKAKGKEKEKKKEKGKEEEKLKKKEKEKKEEREKE